MVAVGTADAAVSMTTEEVTAPLLCCRATTLVVYVLSFLFMMVFTFTLKPSSISSIALVFFTAGALGLVGGRSEVLEGGGRRR